MALDNGDPGWFWLGVDCHVRGHPRSPPTAPSTSAAAKNSTWWLLGLRLAGVAALLVSLIKPSWTTVFERTERPRVAVVIDDSQSMSIMQRVGNTDQWVSRYNQALSWLRDSAAGKMLRDKFDVTVFNIAGDELPMDHLPTEPAAEQTDLVRGLRAAEAKLRGQPAAGIILISDGRDTTGRENFMAMEELPVPAYTIGFKQSPPLRRRCSVVRPRPVLSVDADPSDRLRPQHRADQGAGEQGRRRRNGGAGADRAGGERVDESKRPTPGRAGSSRW